MVTHPVAAAATAVLLPADSHYLRKEQNFVTSPSRCKFAVGNCKPYFKYPHH